MPDQVKDNAQKPGPATGPADLDMSLRQLIDVEGRALALAKRVELIVNDPTVSPELRNQLIAGMDGVAVSSDAARLFVTETVYPALKPKATGSSATAPSPPKRRRQKRPRVTL